MAKTQHIYCILGADMLLLDFAGAITPFMMAKQLGVAIEIHFISPSSQLSLMPTLTNSPQISNISPMPEYVNADDIIMVFGANNADTAMQNPMSDIIVKWLKDKLHNEQTLISVCVGALLLAKAGLLKGKYCTTFYSRLDDLQSLSPSAKTCQNQIFVHDGNVYTSAGITTGVDLALYFVEQKWGSKLSYQIARDMVVYNRRQGSEAQTSPYLMHRNHVHNIVHKAQDLICHAPQASWTASMLAAELDISSRQLARNFASIAQISIAKYVRQIRIGYAKKLMQNNSNSMEDVAFQSGIGTTRSLRRIWHETHNQSPNIWRKLNC